MKNGIRDPWLLNDESLFYYLDFFPVICVISILMMAISWRFFSGKLYDVPGE